VAPLRTLCRPADGALSALQGHVRFVPIQDLRWQRNMGDTGTSPHRHERHTAQTALSLLLPASTGLPGMIGWVRLNDLASVALRTVQRWGVNFG